MTTKSTPKIMALTTHCIFFDAYESAEHSLNTQKKIWGLAQFCQSTGDFVDVVPANNNLTLYLKESEKLASWLPLLLEQWQETTTKDFASTHHKLPTIYGGQHGPDIAHVAAEHNLTVDEVAQLHSSKTYPVLFLGFQPGFAYLDGLDPKLYTPRRSEPRISVPKGSVAIGGEQTGVYPETSPGGWQIIGHTDFKLFDINATSPCAVKPGDTLEFVIQEVLK